MSAEDIEYISDYKEFPTKESALDWLDNYLSLDERNNLIRALQQEPKTGHWIKYGSPRCGEQHYKCTSCGYYINFGQWGELYTKEFKYCPNCSAKMKSEDKE